MVKVEEAVVARYNFQGHKFEVLVEPKLAADLKKGMQVDFEEMLAVDEIYKDAAKGERQSESFLKEAFETTDIIEIAKRIIQKGELQLTTEQRKELREQKRKEIVQLICRRAFDPHSKAPHPPARIENAMTELKIHVNEFEPAEHQVKEITKKLQTVLPLSFEKMEIAVKVPAMHAGKASPVLYSYELKKQEWQKDGSFIAVLEVPAAQKTEIADKLGKLTQGEAEIKILNKES